MFFQPKKSDNLHCKNRNRWACPRTCQHPAFGGNDLELKCGFSCSLCLPSWLSIHQLIPFAPQTASPLFSPLLSSVWQGVNPALLLSRAASLLLCTYLNLESRESVLGRDFLTLPYDTSKSAGRVKHLLKLCFCFPLQIKHLPVISPVLNDDALKWFLSPTAYLHCCFLLV